jgi:hypothetical protein
LEALCSIRNTKAIAKTEIAAMSNPFPLGQCMILKTIPAIPAIAPSKSANVVPDFIV